MRSFFFLQFRSNFCSVLTNKIPKWQTAVWFLIAFSPHNHCWPFYGKYEKKKTNLLAIISSSPCWILVCAAKDLYVTLTQIFFICVFCANGPLLLLLVSNGIELTYCSITCLFLWFDWVKIGSSYKGHINREPTITIKPKKNNSVFIKICIFF